MCEEESEDAEAVAKLLEINDSIHRTIERYRLMKAGNVAEANQIKAGTLGTTTGVSKNAANELSLIDFDPEPQPSSSSQGANGSLLESGGLAGDVLGQTTVEDDLLGLSMDGGGMISLGPSTGGASISAATDMFGNPQFSSQQQRTVPSFTSPMASPPPQASPKPPNYDAFASLTSALPSSKPSTPQPNQFQQQQYQPQFQPQQPKAPPVDPFAALVSAGSRSATPSGMRNTSQIAPSGTQPSLLDLAKPPPTASTAAPAATDDEWNFVSALPSEPESSTTQIHSSAMAISFHARRQAPEQPASNILITALFSNKTTQPITGLHFQVAVEKAYTLQMRPPSAKTVPPGEVDAVKQELLCSGVPAGMAMKVKMRYKVSYELDGVKKEEQGNVAGLGLQT